MGWTRVCSRSGPLLPLLPPSPPPTPLPPILLQLLRHLGLGRGRVATKMGFQSCCLTPTSSGSHTPLFLLLLLLLLVMPLMPRPSFTRPLLLP